MINIDRQRGAALGEEQRVSAAKSVFEYISEKDRERLAAFAAAAKANAPPPPPLSLQPEPERRRETAAPATDIVVPPLSPRTASAALQGFMPFADDLEKQERYRSYLSSQTHNTKNPNPRLLASASVDEVNRELESFAASARIFKPMSFAMSSRFTSGSSALAVSDAHVPKPGLHVFDPSQERVEYKPAHSEMQVEKLLSPREQAAADGKFGELTRAVKDFYPSKLVCRRFHVADPHPEGPPEGKSGAATPTTGSQGDGLLPVPKSDWSSGFVHQSGTDKENTPPALAAEEEGERVPKNLGEVGMADDINQGREILTYTKPSIDIFKAIFASDDEDDDDDDVPEPEASKALAVPEKPKDPYPVDAKPVDYSTFKPVFRRTAEERKEDLDNGDEKVKEKKKKKDKKKRKGVLSFAIEDGDEEAAAVLPKKKSRAPVIEEEVWVEKAPAPGTDPKASRRQGAADFM